jgi:hypothetical protein
MQRGKKIMRSAVHFANRLALIALCFALAMAGTAAHAQTAPSISGSADATTHNWTNEQILTCTVAECWQLAGKTEAGFFDIVQQLAVISAQHRGLTLPETAEAGKRAGAYIKMRAKADHDQLLYAIVDASVRKVGVKAPAAAN